MKQAVGSLVLWLALGLPLSAHADSYARRNVISVKPSNAADLGIRLSHIPYGPLRLPFQRQLTVEVPPEVNGLPLHMALLKAVPSRHDDLPPLAVELKGRPSEYVGDDIAFTVYSDRAFLRAMVLQIHYLQTRTGNEVPLVYSFRFCDFVQADDMDKEVYHGKPLPSGNQKNGDAAE